MQSGFRHGDSTSLHLTNLVQRLCTLRDRRHYLGLCFFDLAKAFDSVWHRGLLAKLHAYGVTGRLQSWLTSYLNNRTQSVKLGPVLSDSIPICSGVPQGSTLEPILFLAFVNDLPVLNPGVSLFADDTCMLRSSPSVSRLILDLQTGITDITSWMALWKLKPNVWKTKVMIIPPLSTTLYYPLPPLVIHFSTTSIKYVDHHRHLGVIFDTNLSWTHHVAHICKKTSQAIGIIYSHRAHLPDSCRALFYNAYILPHFEYCCTAWTNLSIAQQQKLETHNHSLLFKRFFIICPSPFLVSLSICYPRPDLS